MIQERKVDLDYRKMIAQKNMEIDELKAKLKEQAKEIFEDINIGYFEKMIQSGYDSKKDLLCLLELLIRLQDKWVGKE